MRKKVMLLTQACITARLEAAPYFSDVTVVSARKGNVEATIKEALGAISGKAGKIGACLVVQEIIGNVTNQEIPVAQLNMEIVVRAVENVLINSSDKGTQKSSASLAEEVLDVLHQFICHGLFGPVLPKESTIVPVKIEAPYVAHDICFRADALVEFSGQSHCAAVVETHDEQELPYTVTLTCPLAGAKILYTTDGAYPIAGKATEYSAPITINEPATLHVVATKAGLIDSDSQIIQFI